MQAVARAVKTFKFLENGQKKLKIAMKILPCYLVGMLISHHGLGDFGRKMQKIILWLDLRLILGFWLTNGRVEMGVTMTRVIDRVIVEGHMQVCVGDG